MGEDASFSTGSKTRMIAFVSPMRMERGQSNTTCRFSIIFGIDVCALDDNCISDGEMNWVTVRCWSGSEAHMIIETDITSNMVDRIRRALRNIKTRLYPSISPHHYECISQFCLEIGYTLSRLTFTLFTLNIRLVATFLGSLNPPRIRVSRPPKHAITRVLNYHIP
jgi:hypothetical protein